MSKDAATATAVPRTLTWLHLSDLHACEPTTGWDATDVVDDLRQDLERVCEEHDLKPDLVFFTGDAGFGHLGDGDGKSLTSQLEEAEYLFMEIREILGVPQESFFLVPGNHDVHRGRINPSDTSWLDTLIESKGQDAEPAVVKMIQEGKTQWQSFMSRLEDYRKFLKDAGYDHLLEDSERLVYTSKVKISGLDVGVAGFNTAWSCHGSPEKGRLWWGGRWQIKDLCRRIQDCDVKIALTHHPGGWFGEQEAPKVDDMLKERFDLRLHGHEHRGWVEETAGHLRISAGACYASSEMEKGYNFGRLDLDAGHVEVWFRQSRRRSCPRREPRAVASSDAERRSSRSPGSSARNPSSPSTAFPGSGRRSSSRRWRRISTGISTRS